MIPVPVLPTIDTEGGAQMGPEHASEDLLMGQVLGQAGPTA